MLIIQRAALCKDAFFYLRRIFSMTTQNTKRSDFLASFRAVLFFYFFHCFNCFFTDNGRRLYKCAHSELGGSANTHREKATLLLPLQGCATLLCDKVQRRKPATNLAAASLISSYFRCSCAVVCGDFLHTRPTCSAAKPSCQTSRECALPVRFTGRKTTIQGPCGDNRTTAALGRNYARKVIGDCEQQSKSPLLFFCSASNWFV